MATAAWSGSHSGCPRWGHWVESCPIPETTFTTSPEVGGRSGYCYMGHHQLVLSSPASFSQKPG